MLLSDTCLPIIQYPETCSFAAAEAPGRSSRGLQDALGQSWWHTLPVQLSWTGLRLQRGQRTLAAALGPRFSHRAGRPITSSYRHLEGVGPGGRPLLDLRRDPHRQLHQLGRMAALEPRMGLATPHSPDSPKAFMLVAPGRCSGSF